MKAEHTKPDSSGLPVTVAEVPVGSEIVRFELKILNGRPLFSAWRFYDKAGEWKPGRHGLACAVERLPEIADALRITIERARAAGLLPPEGR